MKTILNGMLNDLKDYQEFLAKDEEEAKQDSPGEAKPKTFLSGVFQMRGIDENMEYYQYDHAQAKEAGILLKHKVQKVTYTPSGVTVKATNMITKEELTFEADVVVCTVSIGVLQKGVIEFEPPLPSWKQEAIKQYDMVLLQKVFLNFKKRFWEEYDELLYAHKEKGFYPFFKFVDPKHYHEDKSEPWPEDRNILMAITVADEALRIEKLTNEQIKDEVEGMFKQVYQPEHPDHLEDGESIFRPTDVHVCRWNTNPYTFGSYSYLRVKAFSEQISWRHLQEPLDPVNLEDPISKPPGEK